MKTFTVTLHHTNNYGALFQAYALQTTIKKLGHENTIFEYPYEKNYYTKLSFNNVKKFAVCFYENINKFVYKKYILRRKKGFDDFHSNRLLLSREYSSMSELREEPPEADVYIAGSDQVWRFNGSEFVEARFLQFGSQGVKRISYAASIEKLNYSNEQKNLVQKWLREYSNISLREEDAKDYISKIMGYSVNRVLDPVFLLKKEEWLKIAKPREIDGPYILCYQVQSNPIMNEVVKYLKRTTGYKVVAIIPGATKWISADKTLFDVIPEEFLYLYEHASIIVSASFHGTAFGLLFGKPTYALLKKNGSNRIREIMKLFNQEEFCIEEKSQITDPLNFSNEYYSAVLENEREKSLDYLRKCL